MIQNVYIKLFTLLKQNIKMLLNMILQLCKKTSLFLRDVIFK